MTKPPKPMTEEIKKCDICIKGKAEYVCLDCGMRYCYECAEWFYCRGVDCKQPLIKITN